MSSRPDLHSLTLFASFVLVACVDAGCPQGSQEVDGTCMNVAADGGSDERTSGTEGAGRDGGSAAGRGGTGRIESGIGGSETSPDAATGSDASSDGGAGDAAGGDAMTENPTCGSTACGPNADCSDAMGAPACSRKPGYQGDGRTCTNVDECAAQTHDCDANAACTDSDGSFSCACKPGFEGDGRTCAANPCEPRANPCELQSAECRVDAGKAVCDCKPGRARCDGNALACNTDLTSNADHCGACDFACAGGLACQKSQCEQPVKALALGFNHTCAIDAEDRIVCWGANEAGQLQRDSSPVPNYEPARTTLGPAELISAGADFSCAKLMNDDIVCWGTNAAEQITPHVSQETPRRGLFQLGSGYTQVSQMSSGAGATCMLIEGSPECWGRAVFGLELGTDQRIVLALKDRNRVVLPATSLSLAMGIAQGCALGADRHVRCWGANSDPVPREVMDASAGPVDKAVSVSVGSAAVTACAALESGGVMCWGGNQYGQLGNPTVTADTSASAVAVVDASSTPLSGAVQVAAGGFHACARRKDGTVACWGRRNLLGTGATGTGAQRSFVEVPGIRDAIDVAAKTGHTCVRRRNGQVQCWGENASGQVGVDPSTTPIALEPVNVIGLP